MTITYKKRIVAFLDILGFKDLVQQSVKNSDILQLLHNILTIVQRSQPRWDDPDFQEMLLGGLRSEIHPIMIATAQHSAARERMTSFSDCVVISSPADLDGASEVINRVEMIVSALLTLGVFIRGGITIGDLIHDSGVVFGPGMIEAYQLESKAAHYPRVLVSRHMLEFLNTQQRSGIFDRLILDTDGMVFLDTLGATLKEPMQRVGQAQFYKIIQEQMQPKADRIREGPPEIVAKYAWFVSYFNKAVERLKEVSLIKFPENLPATCQDIAYNNF